MVLHSESGHPGYAHDRCEMRKIGNGRVNERGETQSQACDGSKQRDPARENVRQKQEQKRPGEREVNRPGDHVRLRAP